MDRKLDVDEGELEEGQIPGEWSGEEESLEDFDSPQALVLNAAASSVVRPVPIMPTTVSVADEICYPFPVVNPSELRGRDNGIVEVKKKMKHEKGARSKKRSREKEHRKDNKVVKMRKVEGKLVDVGSDQPALRNNMDNHRGEQTRKGNGTDKLKNVPEILPQAAPQKPTVDEEFEDGEIRPESTKTDVGILSAWAEAQVGLWTLDIVDDESISEMEQDGAVVKKNHGLKKKLKRTMANRKRKAQKASELGIRRPLIRITLESKPFKVLCKYYMKGTCSKGDQCLYSHDAVPLTKLEPCKFFTSHSCLKGDDCPYSHNLRAFPCKFFHTRGSCYNGTNCRFSHEAISEEALASLKEAVAKEKKEKISTISPVPSFSTWLPPQLDPDPWGWRTSTTYSKHEESMERTSPITLDQSTHFDGDLDPGKHSRAPPAMGTMSVQSMDVSSSTDMKDTKSDAIGQLPIAEKAKECKYMQASDTEAVESRKPVHLGGLSRAKLPLPMDLQKPGAPFNSTVPRVVKTPVCSSPPHQQSNAREVPEASRMEGKMDAEQSFLEEPLINLSVHSSMVPSMVPQLAGKLVVPLLRGRQLGSLVVEHEKSPHFRSPAQSNRQGKIEFLLGEALRL